MVGDCDKVAGGWSGCAASCEAWGEGGLEGVIGELQGLREERVRGCKLVFDVDVGESA